MPALLIPLSFGCALLVVLSLPLSDSLRSYRASFLLTSVIWGLILTVLTEVLSLFSSLSFGVLLSLWVATTLILILRLVGGGTSLDLPARLPLHLSTMERWFVLLLFLLVTIVGVIGCIAPPNTYDSMTYHMSRVVHWAQNHSVQHYPTHILRQLHQSPWAEFVLLHLQILGGNDRLANSVQWFAMIGSLTAVSLIAAQLGASLRGQLFAVMACVTLPMGILQASSTQNDYVAAYWLACFVYFANLSARRLHILSVLGAGGSLGLALLTKATSYVYAFPVLVWMACSTTPHGRVRQLRMIALTVAIGLSVNLGHYIRNYHLYEHPFGTGNEGDGYSYVNETFGLKGLTSNVIRNLGLHLGTPFSGINLQLDRTVEMLHALIGMSTEDPRTTWPGVTFRVLPSLHEDSAGNPLHLLFIAACTLWCVRQGERNRNVRSYLSMILAAFILFCLVFKWQPWHSRLQLPLFVLSSPVLGVVLGKCRHRALADGAAACLLVAALPWMFFNSSKPVFGARSIFTTPRSEQYFISKMMWLRPYSDAARVLADLRCGDVGLMIGSNDWEYPLWVALKTEKSARIHIEHVNVTNVSQKTRDAFPVRTHACALFVVSDDPPSRVSIEGRSYVQVWSAESFSVYTMANE